MINLPEILNVNSNNANFSILYFNPIYNDILSQ